MRNLVLLAAALVADGCVKTTSCKGGTALLTVSFDSGAASADQVSFTISVNGGPAQTTVLPHAAGNGGGTVEIDFSGRYPTGATVTVTATALSSQSQIGSGSTTFVALAGCTTARLDVRTTAGGDMAMSEGGATTDMAGDAGVVVPCDPAGVTGPQCVWRWQTPLPQGDPIAGIVAFADDDTLALTVVGQLLRRDASTWKLVGPAATTTSTLTVGISLFTDGNQDAYAVGSLHTGATDAYGLLHSKDRGQTWTQETLPASNPQLRGGAASTTAAVVLDGGTTIFVRDGISNSWGSQTVGAGGTNWSGVSYNSFSRAVLVGANGGSAAIAWSTDAKTWNVVPTASITPSNLPLTAACAVSGSYWAVGNGIILHSTDATSWSQQGAAATGGLNLLGCVAVDATHAWAYGERGAALYTADGTTWNGIATSLGSEGITAAAHSPTQALTLGGYMGGLFRSTNGTTFAREQTGFTDSLNSIFGVAAKTLFAVGSNGTILRTVDDGANWSKLAIPSESGTTTTLNMVWGSSATDVYAVGNGVLVHSSNGTTFQKFTGASIPATVNFTDVYGSALGVFAVGSDTNGNTRVVFRSVDKGATWTPITITGFTGASGVASTVFATATDVWIGGGTSIYHSTNGTSFTSQTTPASSTIGQIRGAAGDTWALVGNIPSTCWRSVNNGAWTATAAGSVPIIDVPVQIFVQPDDSAVVVSDSLGPPAISTNKGASWTILQPGIIVGRDVLTGFAFAPNDTFLVGYTGIVHYGN